MRGSGGLDSQSINVSNPTAIPTVPFLQAPQQSAAAALDRQVRNTLRARQTRRIELQRAGKLAENHIAGLEFIQMLA